MSDNPCDTIYNGSDSRRPADRARKSLTTISNYLIAGCCAGALYLGLTDGPMPVDLRPENWYHSENSQTNENRIS